MMFNQGLGVPVWDEEGQSTGKLKTTDTQNLRSVLLQTMLDKVSDFCEPPDKKQHKKQHYHQVSYNYFIWFVECLVMTALLVLLCLHTVSV